MDSNEVNKQFQENKNLGARIITSNSFKSIKTTTNNTFLTVVI